MTKTAIKIISTSVTIIGMGATLISNWVDDKKMDDKIAEKVAEALAKNAK